MIRLSLVVLLALSGCKKQAPIAAADVDLSSTVSAGLAPAVAQTPQEITEALAANFRRVYFDFDQHELNEQSRAALEANAAILKRHPRVMVEIQGHADERGTTDYNLALGQRRADAVKAFLVLQGVNGSQLTAVSYGEERPAVQGSGETVWSQNRRAEFRITWSDDPRVIGTTE